MDRLSLNIHGNADSHIDALCHVIYDGAVYNDVVPNSWTADGAGDLFIDAVGQGIAGRGLLLDIPRQRGVDWLEPGEHVTADDLTRAEASQQVRIGAGDLLFIRVGHRRRRNVLGPWDAAAARAGLHPSAMELLALRRIAVLGSDGNNDTAPSATDGVDFPVHVLALRALGLHVAGLPAVRGPRAGLRVRRALVIPLRHRAATAAGRHRIAGQPDRHPLTAIAGRISHDGAAA